MAKRNRDIGQRPRTGDELHMWLVRMLGITVQRRGVIARHSGAFEYLEHAFFEYEPTDCVVWANRGGGKTFLGAVATLLDLIFKPGIEIRVLGGSLEQSKRMYEHLRRLFDPEKRPALAAEIAGKVSERRLTLKSGSRVELLAQSQTSVRGTRVQKLRCDEVDLFDEEVWDAAQLATRSMTSEGRLVRGTVECLSTMHVPFGVMHRLVNEAQDGKRRLFRWGVVDSLERCPGERPCAPCALEPECKGVAKREGQAGHISIDDAVTMKRRVSLAVWNAEMLCRRPRRSGTVLPEFDAAIHVYATDEPDADARVGGQAAAWLAGMDFGVRKTVVLWAALDAQGRLWVVDERVGSDVALSVHIAAMNAGLARPGVEAWPRPAWVGIDPAGRNRSEQSAVTNAQLLTRAGFVVRARKMWVPESMELLRARLRPAAGEPSVFVHTRCTTLIESLTCYHYPVDDPDSDKPVRGKHDHAVDALRYLIQNLERPPRAAGGMYL